MSTPESDKCLLEALAQVTEDDELLEVYHRNPGSKVNIQRTDEGGFQFSITRPSEVFWTSAIPFLIGVGLFALIGWGLSLAYQWVIGADSSIQIRFMLRTVSLGICTYAHIWKEENLWDELAGGYRVLLTLLVTIIFAGVIVWEFLLEDYLGLSWAAALLVITMRSYVKES